jgi:peptidyl-prolyl cis-trans isomerase C
VIGSARRPPSRPALTLAAGLALAACSRGSAPAPAPAGPKPVATVNGEPVAAEAVRRELAQLAAGEGEPAAEVKRRAVDAAVDRALLLQAARERRVEPSEVDVERALLALRADYPDGQLEAFLAQEKSTLDETKVRLREQLAIQRVLGDAAAAVAPAEDAEVRAYYAANPAEFAQPEQVRALQVVTRTREDAEKARARIAKSPSSFAEVARQLSIAPEARRGGDLGWFGRGQGMPEVFDACFKLQKDVLSPVVASPYGFHVFKVVDRRPAARRPLEAVRDEIAERLLRERRARAQEDFLAQLRARAKIEIDAAAAEAATREAP